jgi:hypothetical protein
MVGIVFPECQVYSSQSGAKYRRCLPGEHHHQTQRLTTRRRQVLIHNLYEMATIISTEAAKAMLILILTNAALLLAGPRKTLFPSSPVVFKLATWSATG